MAKKNKMQKTQQLNKQSAQHSQSYYSFDSAVVKQQNKQSRDNVQ